MCCKREKEENMLVALVCYTSLMLAATLASSEVGLLAVPGQNVSISCSCPNGKCPNQIIRWIRMYSNGSVEFSETFCKQQRCLLQSNNATGTAYLTLLRVVTVDSALYYCGEKLWTHLDFSGKGTFLVVLEEDVVGESRTEVTLLTEQSSSGHADLRCRVSGLRVPWADVVWRSTRGTPRTLKNITWVSQQNDGGFSVWSQIHLPETPGRAVFSDAQYYDKVHEADELFGTPDHGPLPQEEEEEEENREWWCEVQFGPKLTLRSESFVFKQRKDEPDWCPVVLYSSLAICVLCVLVLLIRSYSCLHQQCSGPTPTPDQFTSEEAEVTYTHLRFEISSGPGSQQSRGTKACLDRALSTSVIYTAVDPQ
ncbi:uncharacterized protein LOC121720787 isoform X2 [Alosa sapidissima]|uniref:uncharacterized protein LOC121720787 isoform X2 n=1 Tax=Alosa sapidissima TaxID=34773 RepID=UPI001C0938DF|nr:uncharacterized protein LOC121720787 isoform X2 [Alosa sapidissima]